MCQSANIPADQIVTRTDYEGSSLSAARLLPGLGKQQQAVLG
jgi:hypothetical protein